MGAKRATSSSAKKAAPPRKRSTQSKTIPEMKAAVNEKMASDLTMKQRMLRVEHVGPGFDDVPAHEIVLDHGSWIWLCGVLEAKLGSGSAQWVEPYQRLVARTFKAFKDASHDKPKEEPEEAPRRIIRRRRAS